MLPPTLLGPDDPAPVTVLRGAGRRLVIVCAHAGKAVPRGADPGVAQADLDRHIGWDIGALAVARRLAEAFDATLVATRYSRLVIDANRYPFDPAAMPEISDGTPVPGNVGLSPAARWRRVVELHRPYHDAIAAEIERLGAPFFLSVHSMTDRPRATGRPRPWQVALSRAGRCPASKAALAVLRADRAITVGDNEPYALDFGEDFTTPEHAVRRGLSHLQVEFRQDLIADAAGAQAWADRFAPALSAAMEA